MLRLPDVSLVVVETRAHELSKRTVEDCLSKVQFSDVRIFTDKPEIFKSLGVVTVLVPNWGSKDECCRFCQFQAWDWIKTSHGIFLEWDAGLCDVSMWRDSFLDYSYIGAPWWYTDGSPNVGNGGFSLRSVRLMKFLKEHQDKYPALTDNQLCRDYGDKIRIKGKFNWALNSVANDFAFEGFDRVGLPNNLKHFGFHGSINWAKILDKTELIERARLMKKNPYVTSTGRTDELFNNYSWLNDEVYA